MPDPYVASDPFAAGLFPVCPTTHDQGLRWLFAIATLLPVLECRPGDRVLDIGAGSGFSSEMLARFGYQVVAIDPDAQALANNRRRPSFDASRIQGTVRVAQGLAERLPFADASFDGVLAMNVLHHVPDLELAVSELHRVLRPGRRVVVSEPGLDHLTNPETQRAIADYGENDRPFDVIEFLRVARARGFSEAMLTLTLYPPMRLIQLDEIEIYRSGQHQRKWLTPEGIIHEVHHRHAYGILVREGPRAKTSRYPGHLQADLVVTDVPPRARGGETFTAIVRAKNVGDTIWLAQPSAFGGYVTAGCKLRASDGRLVTDVLGRTCVPRDVAPGEEVNVAVTIELPEDLARDTYVLEFDMVNELVCWFADAAPGSAVRHPLLVE